jgi:hypothetical protein
MYSLSYFTAFFVVYFLSVKNISYKNYLISPERLILAKKAIKKDLVEVLK